LFFQKQKLWFSSGLKVWHQQRGHGALERRRGCMQSYEEEEDACMSYEEEDTYQQNGHGALERGRAKEAAHH